MQRPDWKTLIPSDICNLYELHNYNHAAEVLTQAFATEFNEILATLRSFRITTNQLIEGGGSESAIPKILSATLHPLGWKETRIQGDLILKLFTNEEGKRISRTAEPISIRTIESFIDGHNIDYVKDRVACDLEWNSKDQTFDRDLYAMRTYHEVGIISAGIIITRSEELNDIFHALNIHKKYGASTTWMGKLLPRLNTGRHGGCPILAIGITKKIISDWTAGA